ncbi:MAG: helix-turn-helix domain-containing protein [Eubacteriales bacterium]
MENSEKYNSLVDTAKRLFFKYGVKRVTVEEICTESNVSKMTFYKFFKNKTELAVQIRDQLTEEGFAKFDEINKRDISFMEKIDLTTAWRIEFASSMTEEFMNDIMDLEYIHNQQEAIKNRYLSNIKKAQEKGEINPDLSTEVIWYVTQKFNEFAKEAYEKKLFENNAQMQTQLREIYFYGLVKRNDR